MSAGDLYVHPQQTWDEAECARRAKSAPADFFGNKPPVGLINRSAAPYPSYGQTVRYNGGCIRDDKWYAGETVPLPTIPDSYEFHHLCSWGTIIRKKK